MKNFLQSGNRILYVLIAVILWCTLLPGQESKPALWKDLTQGPYSVGYKVVNLYDYTCTFKPKYDYEGSPLEEVNARPVQVSVWYPAAAMKKPEYMPYSEYHYATCLKIDFKPLNETVKTGYWKNFISYPLKMVLMKNYCDTYLMKFNDLGHVGFYL